MYNGPDSASVLRSIPTRASLALFAIFTMKSAVAESSATVVPLPYWVRLPSDDIFALLIITLLVLIDLSFLALFFSQEATSRASNVMILTSFAERLSFPFRKLLLRGQSFNDLSPKIYRSEKQISNGQMCRSTF